MRFDVLVVEDEVGLLRGIVRGLGADPSLHLEGVSTVERAEEILDSSAPDLLITDIRLPGRSGLDLLLELERRSLRIPVVVMTAHMAEYEDRLANRIGLTILEKPVPLVELRRIVKEKLETETTESRSTPFQLQDYLQLASLGRHSLAFDVELPDGRSGRLDVVEGEVWNVHCADEQGESALRILIEAALVEITFNDLTTLPGVRQLTGSTQSILLALAQQSDEERRDGVRPTAETVGSEATGSGAFPESATAVAPPSAESTGKETGGTSSAESNVDRGLLGRLCRRVMGEVAGATACGIVDAGAQSLYGRALAEGRPAHGFPSRLGLVVVDLLRRVGQTGGDMPCEALAASSDEVALAHLGAGLDLGALLEVEAGSRQGMAWLAVRGAREIRGVEVPERGLALGEVAAITRTGELDVGGSDPAVEQICQGLLSQQIGARMFAVVDPSRWRLIGSSDPPASAGRSLVQPLPWALMAHFEAAGRDSVTLTEVYVSGEERWWLRALDGTPHLVLLWADHKLQPGLARTCLSSALDPLRKVL